ncbi:MAG: nucleotide exchange factor GrpE [Pseudomonadales bacterium]|nr:nucleotide exchange factor GrpE [Pseudomonadales bacterium]
MASDEEAKKGSAESFEEPAAETGSADEELVQARIQEAVQAALSEQKDSVLRAQAEVQNMRRRCEADVEKAHRFALEKFSTELITVMDNLERALQAAPNPEHESVKALYEGLELTQKGFLEILNKFNIEQIDPGGEPFDPDVHQAVATQESQTVEPNTVLAVMQKGYLLNGRVIRPAMVMVAKAAQG